MKQVPITHDHTRARYAIPHWRGSILSQADAIPVKYERFTPIRVAGRRPLLAFAVPVAVDTFHLRVASVIHLSKEPKGGCDLLDLLVARRRRLATSASRGDVRSW